MTFNGNYVPDGRNDSHPSSPYYDDSGVCSCCGRRDELTLIEEEYLCPECIPDQTED